MIENIAGYFAGNGGHFAGAVGHHLMVSGLAVLAAFVLSWPLGALCAQNKAATHLVNGVFGSLRIVPSLALLFLAIPLLGTGLRPSVAALTALAMPPLLLNTQAAFAAIAPAITEAAVSLGMSRARVFWTVKAPLALPLVFTGLRTAVVEVIAAATLAAYIGGGGLGEIIFTGLGLMKTELLIIGGASVTLLALGADALLSVFEKQMKIFLFGGQNEKWKKRSIRAVTGNRRASGGAACGVNTDGGVYIVRKIRRRNNPHRYEEFHRKFDTR